MTQVPYIDSDAGHAEWGGWNAEGRNKVKDLAKKIVQARKRDHVAKMEEDVLDRVRQNNEVVERDNKRSSKNNKRKRAVIEEEDVCEFDNL